MWHEPADPRCPLLGRFREQSWLDMPKVSVDPDPTTNLRLEHQRPERAARNERANVSSSAGLRSDAAQ
jgi:hypothetical protein